MAFDHLQVDTSSRQLDNATGAREEVRVADINLVIITIQIICKMKGRGNSCKSCKGCYKDSMTESCKHLAQFLANSKWAINYNYCYDYY